ncbi:MAG TPA: hypothetical protein VNE67_17030 [Acetobacteraceae bacterium]|nr:hypothetical protein [Acetobacteraceae bacterium]
MRYVSLAAVALAGMTSLAVLAQTTPPPPGSAPTSAPPGSPIPTSLPPGSVAQAPGARPGHEPGVGASYPLSNHASNIRSNDTHSVLAPTLPTPALGPDATVQDYLRAARTALDAGQTGQAQQALEMAETRALDRSVPQGATNAASHSDLVARIGAARRALGAGHRAQAMQRIDAALGG